MTSAHGSSNTALAPVRIGNCSGFYGDRHAAMREMLTGGDLDYLTGDYLAELTMLILARDRAKSADRGYAKTFLSQLEECLGTCARSGRADRRQRRRAEPGGSCRRRCGRWPNGSACRPRSPTSKATTWWHARASSAWAATSGGGTPLAANAYLGAWGIVDCLNSGADVVVTGRVTDASVIVGPAAAHFGWARDDYDCLAGAVAAGHVIECGVQATGGNYRVLHRSTRPDPRRVSRWPRSTTTASLGDHQARRAPAAWSASTPSPRSCSTRSPARGTRIPM